MEAGGKDCERCKVSDDNNNKDSIVSSTLMRRVVGCVS